MTTPFPEELQEAKAHPGKWVYRIAGVFSDNEAIPPEAIVGAWKVDDHGQIVGDFLRNEDYDPERWPSPSE